jgi:hypothetical protein
MCLHARVEGHFMGHVGATALASTAWHVVWPMVSHACHRPYGRIRRLLKAVQCLSSGMQLGDASVCWLASHGCLVVAESQQSCRYRPRV